MRQDDVQPGDFEGDRACQGPGASHHHDCDCREAAFRELRVGHDQMIHEFQALNDRHEVALDALDAIASARSLKAARQIADRWLDGTDAELRAARTTRRVAAVALAVGHEALRVVADALADALAAEISEGHAEDCRYRYRVCSCSYEASVAVLAAYRAARRVTDAAE